MDEKRKPTIGITLGDINGVGPQVVLKALAYDIVFRACNIVLFGNESVLQFYKKEFPELKTPYQVLNKEYKLNPKMVNLVECNDKPLIVNMGVSTDFTGSMAIRFLNEAIDYFQKGKIDAIVTAPVNKATIKTNPPFYGHTEYIAQKLGKGQEPLMIMTSDYLKVALATHHVALAEVSSKLTTTLIFQKLLTFKQSLKSDFGIHQPKIAVLALNPHSGEGGKIGKEEQEIIAPAIQKAIDNRVICQGPFAADGFFSSGKFQHFDGILAMYHDQGLIPFKYIAGMEGINFTANLDIVRTSPDHGVALDIVSSNSADPNSMLHSILAAVDILNTRQNIKKMYLNPLKKLEIKDLEK